MKFDVLRQHYGDKQYMIGDVREATEADVAHLVASGVLKRKSEPKVQNKAEKAAPKNKSAG